MSWSGNCVIPKEAKAATALELLNTMEITGNEDCPSERFSAVESAKVAVKEIIGMYDVEDDWISTSEWRINIGGHVNPGNLPRAGWANDYTNIRVEQV